MTGYHHMNMNKNTTNSAGDRLAHDERLKRCAELGIVVPIHSPGARRATPAASRATVPTDTAQTKQ